MLIRTSFVIIVICGQIAVAQFECPTTFDEVTASGVEPSGAIVNGSPAVAYVDSINRDLFYATLSEKGWVSEEVFIGTALFPSLADVDSLTKTL